MSTGQSVAKSDFIDVRQLMAELSVKQLCQTAENYFRKLDNYDYHLAKPFADVNETPELLMCFAQVLQGLRLVPDLSILDFGAGSCWSSRYLTQLGFKVIAMDVSSTALEIGQELYARQPVIGNQPLPQFLVFDGRRIELPDESIDRITCFDAFHHVPNPGEVLKEMGRVLKGGGIAGFSEPGPHHSCTPQSQYEMRLHGVIENDIDMCEIWTAAHAAGFTGIELAVFHPFSFRLSLTDFEDYLAGGDANAHFAKDTNTHMQNRRVFFLLKGSPASADSRQRAGLLAQLRIDLVANTVKAGQDFLVHVRVTNCGSAIWLPSTAPKGPVNLGLHLYDAAGQLLNRDYFRQALTPGAERPIQPGETVGFETRIPSPAPGRYVFEFDLVSEMVCWFALNGSETVRREIEVV
jgi:SAM-dependent methyltransferase